MAIVLAADVGGTNANFSIVNTDDYKIIYKESVSTRDASDFSELVNGFLDRARASGHAPVRGCFAVAGPVETVNGRNLVRMTNAHLTIGESNLEKKTRLRTVSVINDFAAIGYSINVLPSKSMNKLRRGTPTEGVRAVIGPGTGLGKCFLMPDGKGSHSPHASEGSHVPFAATNDEEYALASTVAREVGGWPSEEHLVSGPGLERIYRYLQTRFSAEQNLSAARISETAAQPCSAATLDIFRRLLARSCSGFALATLATGGIYIAGGIAAKNLQLFGPEFLADLDRHTEPKFAELVSRIPVYVITDYDCSLLGAAYAASRPTAKSRGKK